MATISTEPKRPNWTVPAIIVIASGIIGAWCFYKSSYSTSYAWEVVGGILAAVFVGGIIYGFLGTNTRKL